MKMHRSITNAGFSEVISTVILSSAIISITIIASFVATSYLDYQSQENEFEQAKQNMLRLAELIDDSVSNPGYGGYVRVNLVSARIIPAKSFSILKVSVSEIGDVLSDAVDALSLQAGSRISTPNIWNRGNGNLSMTSAADPLGHIKSYQQGGAFVTLDFQRVRITKLGTFYYLDIGGGIQGYVDEFQISYINCTVGKMQGVPNAMNLMARNAGVVTRRYLIPSKLPLTVTVTSTNPPGYAQMVLQRDPSTVAALVSVVVDNVELTGG